MKVTKTEKKNRSKPEVKLKFRIEDFDPSHLIPILYVVPVNVISIGFLDLPITL